jgi:chromosome segregation ATPase
LSIANKDADYQLHAMKDEFAHLKAICDGKAREIGDLSDSINLRNCDNNALRDQIKDVEKAILAACDESRSLRLEIAGTNDDIEKLTADIHVTENCIKNRENDISGLNANISKRMIDIDDKNKDISSAESEVHRLNDNIGKAKHDQASLRHRLDDETARHLRMRKENEDHCAKGHMLRSNIRELEGQNANRDAQIVIMRDEIDKLNHALMSSEECNSNLDEELGALHKHSDVLTNQNAAFNRELEDAVANEEFVRRELDRSGKISAIRKDNEDNLRNSMHMFSQTKSRSPMRR